MTESDGEIEYLDEDAEIVQQCVQADPAIIYENVDSDQKLLVERTAERKRRRRRDEEDSDYDPSLEPDTVTRGRKKKTGPPRKVGRPTLSSYAKTSTFESSLRTVKKKEPRIDLKTRKNMDIRIPDYEDPLCLPVRALKKSAYDLQRLKNWNNVCLEHFKHCNSLLKPERGQTKSSSRSIVLRSVALKESGKQAIAVWSKTCVENTEGVKKSEIFQSILPKYREKKVLNPYNLQWQKREHRFKHTTEVLLTKEEQKDGEFLVVYKPNEKLSAVYKYAEEVPSEGGTEDRKKTLREAALCRVCAPCYQTSWRGSKKTNEDKISCPICKRPSVSVYNLLTHLKAHQSSDVIAHKEDIAVALSEVVDYHYKCRICLEQFFSIKELRQHINTHRGTEVFKCEVGNHMAT